MTKKILMTIVVYVTTNIVNLLFIENLSTNYAMVYSKGNTKQIIRVTPKKTTRIKEQKIYGDDVLYGDVKGTVYHAVAHQTDDTPLITADGSKIDTARVNELRWIAVSRDMLKLKTSRYNFNGKLRLGDTVWISYDRADVIKTAKARKVSPEVLLRKYDLVVGWWVVKDTMGDYCWIPAKMNVSELTPELVSSGEFKVDKKGVLVKKSYQRKWIDFLQHPKTGMLEYWNKSLIITKKKVVGHNIEVINE